MKLDGDFFSRESDKVARDLLGCYFVRDYNPRVLKGRIVETEAYFGPEDPASRAKEKKTKINENMWKSGGTILVYMIHGHWLFNIVTEEEGVPGAVLIRAVEPVKGIGIMKRLRDRNKERELASGPGKFTQAFDISEKHHGGDVTSSDIFSVLDEDEEEFEIDSSHRIGVSEDLEEEFRFFIEDNKHVSK